MIPANKVNPEVCFDHVTKWKIPNIFHQQTGPHEDEKNLLSPRCLLNFKFVRAKTKPGFYDRYI